MGTSKFNSSRLESNMLEHEEYGPWPSIEYSLEWLRVMWYCHTGRKYEVNSVGNTPLQLDLEGHWKCKQRYASSISEVDSLSVDPINTYINCSELSLWAMIVERYLSIPNIFEYSLHSKIFESLEQCWEIFEWPSMALVRVLVTWAWGNTRLECTRDHH